MGLEDVLIYVRGAIYLATFLLIASFKPRGSRWRPMVSFFAVGLAGSCFSLAMISFLQPPIVARVGPMWLQTLYCLCVFGLVLGCRGNLGKIVPPFKVRANR